MAAVMTTARFGSGVVVDVQTSQYGDASRTIAFSAPIQLGENDLVAALWLYARGVQREALADLVYVRELVADAFVNAGLDEVNVAREQLAVLVVGTPEHAWSLEIGAAVRRAFALALPGAARCGAARLVAVSS